MMRITRAGKAGLQTLHTLWQRCLDFGEASAAPTLQHVPSPPWHDGPPAGRITLVQGPEGSGKTDVCLAWAVRAQARAQRVAWLHLDQGGCLNTARAAGLDPATPIAACGDIPRALGMARVFIDEACMDMLVLDPWPPAVVPDRLRPALKQLARAAAAAGTRVVIARTWPESHAHRIDALRYVAAAVLHVGIAGRVTPIKAPRGSPSAAICGMTPPL